MNPQPYPKYRIFSSADGLAETVANEIFLAAKSSDSQIHVSLSGGSTPTKLFAILAGKFLTQMPWARIHFWWGDERCVPPNNPQSNYGTADSLLLKKILIPQKNIHRIRGEENPLQEANRYAQEMKTFIPLDFQGLPVFDWMILGVGTDGHTASLFPKDMPLDSKSLTIATAHPDSGQNRISMGMGVICTSKNVRFLVTGQSKVGIINHIFKNAPEAEHYPSNIISRQSNNAEWWLDREAAEALY